MPGDWDGIDFPDPVGFDAVNFVQISYAAAAFGVHQLDALAVTNSQFSYNQAAFTVAGTADHDPVLGALPCVPPYLSVVEAKGDWFGASGYPAPSLDVLSFVGTFFIPDEFSSLYGSLSSMITVTATIPSTDNTVPWAIYSCPAIGVPALPVSAVDFWPRASGPLWPQYAQKN